MRYPGTRPLVRRMQAIDQALRARKWPTDKTLANDLEVDPRTIRRDLEFMRDEHHAPIAFDRVRRGYHYTEPTYRLPLLQMSQGELLALYLSERLMRQFRGTPFEPDLRQAIAKLGDMLPDGVTVRLDEIADFLSVLPSTQAEYNPESFCTLLHAVLQRRRLHMVYWTASRNETAHRDFDPYELSLISDGWYVFGHCHRAKAIRQFAVQRVRSVKETGETFDRPADFCAADHMKHGFRALRGDGDHDVVLRFSPTVAGLIRERVWHPSQKLEDQPDGRVVLKLHLDDLRNIKRWVMSWGIDCEVLEPPELRTMIATELREMLGRTLVNHPNEAAVNAGSGGSRDKARRGRAGR
jgi:predicted DNA-binding transcriptional regulator YafY